MADKDFDKVLRDNACGVRKNAKVPEDVLKILKPNPLPVRQVGGEVHAWAVPPDLQEENEENADK